MRIATLAGGDQRQPRELPRHPPALLFHIAVTPTLVSDRYELGSLLGTGGSSRVFRARDRRLDREVAIKLLNLDTSDPRASERFLREALVGSRISHPHAVTVFDTGDDDGVLYITMELIAGEDLAHRLRRTGPLPEGDAAAIADSVLDILHAAHTGGVIHRDVKPSNIILQDNGVARLVDFGIARTLGELTAGLTKTGQIIGTAKYISPEQAAGETLTPATDLYSLGVVLYEMLTGRVPFAADNAIAVALAHREQAPPAVQTLVPNIDAGLAAVVHRSLGKDPDARYPSAAAMRDALATRGEHAFDPTAALTAGTGAGQAVDPTASLPAAGTEVYPTSAPGAAKEAWNRRTKLIAATAALAAIIVVVTLVLLSGDETDPAGVTAESNTTSTSPATTDPASQTSAPPATSPASLTIGELTDQLTQDPSAFGEKGEDLLDKLQKIQREKEDKQGEEAAKTLEEIDKWVAEGELDPTIAERARTVLRPIVDA